MAVNTTSDFTLTRNELIQLALGIIGVTEPQNDDYSLATKVLNSLVRHLDAKGEWLWAVDSTESSLVSIAGQAEYLTGVGASNIDPNILRLTSIFVEQSSSERRQLRIYSKHEAHRSLLKDDTNSEPIAAYFERATLRSDNVLTLYPTPNRAYTIKYAYRRPLYDFVLPSNNPDFPSEWFLPLQKMLAYELASHYGKPLQERQLLKMDSDMAFKEVEKFSQDDPSYVTLKAEYF